MLDGSHRARRALAPLLALTLVTGPAWAEDIIVDDDGGPGIDYTDLPTAVAAAQPGDRLFVNPGSYDDFVLSKSLTILGTGPGVHIDHGTTISSLGFNGDVVLADLEPRDLVVVNCLGSVVFDSILVDDSNGGNGPQLVRVEDCLDVRFFDCSILGPTFNTAPFGRDGLLIYSSHCEVVQSVIRGEKGPGSDCGQGGVGGNGVVTDYDFFGGFSTEIQHFSQSEISGGAGGGVTATCTSFCNQGAGDAGHGVFGRGGVLSLLTGKDTHFIQGGFSGDGGECLCDGEPGDGLYMENGGFLHSGAQLLGGGEFCGSGGQAVTLVDPLSYAQLQSPRDPFLELQGSPAAGAQVRFSVFGAPGDQVTLFLGRFPIVQAQPLVVIDKLTTEERMFDLGTIGPAGNASFLLTVPSALPAGFWFFAQGRVVRSGTEHRTNSVPVVLR